MQYLLIMLAVAALAFGININALADDANDVAKERLTVLCEEYGFKRRTPAMFNCLQELAHEYNANLEIQRKKQAAFQACANHPGGRLSFGESMAAGQACAEHYDNPDAWSINQPKQNIHCNRTITGGLDCNSY